MITNPTFIDGADYTAGSGTITPSLTGWAIIPNGTSLHYGTLPSCSGTGGITFYVDHSSVTVNLNASLTTATPNSVQVTLTDPDNLLGAGYILNVVYGNLSVQNEQAIYASSVAGTTTTTTTTTSTTTTSTSPAPTTSTTSTTTSPAPTTSTTTTPAPQLSSAPTWQPCLLFSLGEVYTPASTAVSRYLYLSVVQPDGFPWGRAQTPPGDSGPPTQIVVSSAKSTFTDPTNSAAVTLGNSIVIPFGTSTTILSDSSVVTLGYQPVSGDVLTAVLYVGDSRFSAKVLTV